MSTVIVICPLTSFDKNEKTQTGNGLGFNPHAPESAERRAKRLYLTDITGVTGVTKLPLSVYFIANFLGLRGSLRR